jgi:hypothetical protein
MARFLLYLAAVMAVLPLVSAWWADAPIKERGEPPYEYPSDREYRRVKNVQWGEKE